MPFSTYESFLVHATYHTWSSLGLSFFFNKNVIYIIFDQKKIVKNLEGGKIAVVYFVYYHCHCNDL